MSDKKNAPPAPVLKCLVFIIDWEKSGILADVFERIHVRFHFIAKGRGTASSEMLNVLGIGSSEKAVFFCLEQDIMAAPLLKEASIALGFYRPRAGIAFAIPLTGINTPVLQVFKKSVVKEVNNFSEKERIAMTGGLNYELIIAVVNQGYSDELMAVAREAGAGGGTVINVRGLMHEGPVKFFGISVQEEREAIMILTSKEKKIPIMRAVSRDFGIGSKAAGLVYALPVDSVLGVNLG
jgi:nitrogen regulatory protein PII